MWNGTRNIDGDLYMCLAVNKPHTFKDVWDIDYVLAVWQGKNGGDEWRWIIRLENKKFVFIQGECCPYGWSCCSSAEDIIFDDLVSCVDCMKGYTRYSSRDNSKAVYDSIVEQLKEFD